jgi:hypothetical protein
MSSSDIRDGLVYKGCTNCVQHHVIIDLKSILCWFLNIAYGVSLAIGSIRELYVSTLCLDVMLISMLINDFIVFCMILIYHLCFFTTTMFKRERERERERSSTTLSHKTNTLVSWRAKLLVYCCRLLEEGKRNNHHFPREFDINPQVTLVGEKHPCCITLRLE